VDKCQIVQEDSQKVAPLFKKDAEWHLKSIHLAKIREWFGGAPAFHSSMMDNAIAGLKELGWTEEAITDAIEKEFSADSP